MTIGFEPVAVDEHNQRFGKASANVLLGEVHNLGVGAAEVALQFVNEEPRELDVFVDEFLHDVHVNHANL